MFFGFMPFAGLALLTFLAFGAYALYSAGYGSGYRTAMLAGESAAALAPGPGGGWLIGLCFAGLAFFGLLFAFGGLAKFLLWRGMGRSGGRQGEEWQKHFAKWEEMRRQHHHAPPWGGPPWGWGAETPEDPAEQAREANREADRRAGGEAGGDDPSPVI